MEIKTSEQIFHSVNDGVEKDKKWVAVEDVERELYKIKNEVMRSCK